MATGIDMKAISKSIVKQLQLSDIDELNYILKDIFKDMFTSQYLDVAANKIFKSIQSWNSFFGYI